MSRKNEVNNWIKDLTKMYQEVRAGKADLTSVKAAQSVSRQVLTYMKFEHQLNRPVKSKRKAA